MQLRIAAYAVIVDGAGNILLSHWVRERASAWTLPGGGMEIGEQPDGCVRREIREETGYIAQIGDVLGVDSRVIRQSRRLTGTELGDLHQLRVLYRATVTGGKLRAEREGSSDMARWFPLAALPTRRTKLVDLGIRMADAFSVEAAQ